MFDRAAAFAERHDAWETATTYIAERAMLDAEVGNQAKARADAAAALKLAPNRDVRGAVALALVRAGDVSTGEKLAEQLNRSYPLDTIAQRYWIPVIRSAASLARNDPTRAAALLDTSADFEFAGPMLSPGLVAIYLHGTAYLALHDGTHAAAEFQKYIDNYGRVRNSPWGALARLGLARSYAMQGDSARARKAYSDFLTLWKDADPDIPLLKQAQREYAALSRPTTATLPANASSPGRE